MAPICRAATILTATLKTGGVRGFSSCFVNRPICALHPTNLIRVHKVISPTNSITSSPSGISLSNTKLHMSFVDFLQDARSSLLERLKQNNHDGSNHKPIQLIMGNEAGDADSVISAISFAHVNILRSSNDSSNAHNVPLVSIPRADLALRRDAVLLLDMAGIDMDKLLFVDDEVMTGILGNTDTSLQSDVQITLVDHNRVRSSLAHLSDRVSEIIDHHEDELFHDHVTIGSGKRVIAFDRGLATVASTCTIVAERLFQAIGPNATIDRSLGLVLLGVILLDSVNMLPEAGKGTDRDEAAIQTLLKQTDWSSSGNKQPTLVDVDTLDKIFPNGKDKMPDRTALFQTLSNSKFDPKFWNEMSARDCLRIDYKKFPVTGQGLVQSIGLSSVLVDVDSLIKKQQFYDTMADFVASENVDIFGVLTLYFNEEGSPIRDLLLTGRDVELVNSFTEYLLAHPDAAFLQIQERESWCSEEEKKTGVQIRLFTQGNAKGSRKQVAPVLLNHASTISRL